MQSESTRVSDGVVNSGYLSSSGSGSSCSLYSALVESDEFVRSSADVCNQSLSFEDYFPCSSRASTPEEEFQLCTSDAEVDSLKKEAIGTFTTDVVRHM